MPTLQDGKPDHILHAGTNDFHTKKTPSQIEKSLTNIINKQ